MKRIDSQKIRHISCCLLLMLFFTARGWASTSYVDLVKGELAFARENLRVSMATRDRVAAALQALKYSGQASPEVIADYETYLSRLTEMVEENRKMVARLTSLQTATITAAGVSVAESQDGSVPGAVAKPYGEKVSDPVDALDRELDDSLAEFDAILLKELALIRTTASQRMNDLSEEAAAAARRLKEKGIDLESEEGVGSSSEGREGQQGESGLGQEPGSEKDGGQAGQSTDRDSGQGGAEQSGRSAGSGQGEAGGKRAENDRSGEGGQGQPGGKQARYESGADDDIVARQLREAAEKETDPELKEKLWKEYEDYKKSQR